MTGIEAPAVRRTGTPAPDPPPAPVSGGGVAGPFRSDPPGAGPDPEPAR